MADDDGRMLDLSAKIETSDCFARNEAPGFPMSNLFIGDSRLGCKSDADEQLIIHVSFQEFVKVRFFCCCFFWVLYWLGGVCESPNERKRKAETPRREKDGVDKVAWEDHGTRNDWVDGKPGRRHVVTDSSSVLDASKKAFVSTRCLSSWLTTNDISPCFLLCLCPSIVVLNSFLCCDVLRIGLSLWVGSCLSPRMSIPYS
jgi:PITH domain